MTLWIILAALSLALVLWIAWPLVRPRPTDATRAEYDAAVYYDQFQELERDQARGLIDATQAEGARAEIEQRLLAAGRAAGMTNRPRVRQHVLIAVALAIVLPLATVLLYLDLGSPGLPNQPFAEREQEPAVPDAIVAEAQARLQEAEARTKATPDNEQAWFDLGRLRLVAGDIEAATDALSRARELEPNRPDIASAHGEALARAADGLVTPAARQAFMAALAGNSADPRARYFLALGEYQLGREQDALEAWSSLAGDAPADAPWLPTVRARIIDTARELGHDPDDWLPQEPAVARGPSEADIAAAQDLSDDDRQAMIRGMVDNLAARLETEPEDLGGWRMLARSWETLGEPGKAARAYARALEIEPDHPETLLRAAVTSAQSGDTVRARAIFSRLSDIIPPDTEAHRMISEAIARIDADTTENR